MLKKRIIPKFLIKGGRLVKGVRFTENMREAGNPVTTAKIYNDYGVDELIILDIEATLENRRALSNIINKISEELFMPFTVGGGVKSLDDINALLKAGADKVSINTAAIENPEFIKEAAKHFGSQCITIAIDYKEVENNKFQVFSHSGTKLTAYNPVEWAKTAEEMGCGEILICSIDRDGTMNGFDIGLVKELTKEISVPILVSGGAGSLKDCFDALNAGASAIVISSMFLFSDHSPIKVRSYLASNHINVRASKNSRD